MYYNKFHDVTICNHFVFVYRFV